MSAGDLEENSEDLCWEERIRQAVGNNRLIGITCGLHRGEEFNNNVSVLSKQCTCGRYVQEDSFIGKAKKKTPVWGAEWKPYRDAVDANVTVFGTWQNKIKFVRWDDTRVDPSIDTGSADSQKIASSLPTIAKIIRADVKHKKLTLLISCYGGAKYFKMHDKLETKFMEGIGQAAATKGVWLLSAGLNSGVSEVIGQSIWRFNLINKQSTNPTVIGLSSWGCLSERTRNSLRMQAKFNAAANRKRRKSVAKVDALHKLLADGISPLDLTWTVLDENEPDTMELNHTHLLLLDDGSEGDRMGKGKIEPYYLTDEPRSRLVDELVSLTKCYAVTIIVEGGLNSISVIKNDLAADPKRPVVIIHGSGRLANIIGNLLELTRDEIPVGDDDIKQQVKKMKKVITPIDLQLHCDNIKTILKPENRPYLTVFKLDDNTSLTDTIFLSVFKADMYRRQQQQQQNQWSNDSVPDDSLKTLLNFSIDWNHINGINYVFENKETITYDSTWDRSLFANALLKKRPVFVDYFLRRQHKVLDTAIYCQLEKNIEGEFEIVNTPYVNNTRTSSKNTGRGGEDPKWSAQRAIKFIEELYQIPIDHVKDSYITDLSIDLDSLYYASIGPYVGSFFHQRKIAERLKLDRDIILRSCRSLLKHVKNELITLCCCCLSPDESSNDVYPEKENVMSIIIQIPDINADRQRNSFNKVYGNEEMLRDIFLWSVISGHAEMSFVLLLQIKSRIVASLIAAGITGRFLKTRGGYLDVYHQFKKQSKVYEDFATSCIDTCYEKSERDACQLLLREIPFFGNVTCMQVAISFRLRSFINTRCFNQVLNRQWYGTLDQSTNQSVGSKISFILSIMTLGLLAPLLLDYRNDFINIDKQETFDISTNEKLSSNHRWEGIEDQDSTMMNYYKKFIQFHRTPIVRMFYDFIFYIWMLLAFSYMMLFHMKPEDTSTHWTEIYVIVTISAMLIEDIRKIFIEYCTQMLERWHQSDLWIVPLYTLPYILFYIGIGIQFGSRAGRPDLFTTARIILALDLELWFLFSLRFVSAVKLLGPKLFMIRNMVRDLAGFIYIIFICIAAYGIVSRSLTMYENIEFTARNLSASIFYPTYWLLYSIADDEKNYYDGIIGSPTSSADQVAAATTTQVLLAFHMLFINILILNLLIAVFNFSINAVQEESEYLWRYQRYELIREYFEKPPLAYPPLSVLGYLWPLYKWIRHGKDILRILKRFTTQKRNKDWTDFEGAATFAYARHFVDRMYRDSSTLVIPTFSETDELKLEIESLKRQNNELYKIIDRLDIHSKKTTPAMNWIMGAMKRVKMSKEEPPLFRTSTSDS